MTDQTPAKPKTARKPRQPKLTSDTTVTETFNRAEEEARLRTAFEAFRQSTAKDDQHDNWLHGVTKAKPAERPYVLESSVIEDDLRRAADNANAEIDAIDADLLSIEERANRDVSAIIARRDAEIASRTHRRHDLSRIVAMATRGLTEPAEPAYYGPGEARTATSTTLALQLEQQRQQDAPSQGDE